MVLHAGIDFVAFLHAHNRPAPISDRAAPSLIVLVAASLAYSLVLTRPSKVRGDGVTAPA
jgi:hypothetical protein